MGTAGPNAEGHRPESGPRRRRHGPQDGGDGLAPDLQDDPDAPQIERTGPSALAVHGDGKRCVKPTAQTPACLSQGCTSICRSTDGVAPGSGLLHRQSAALPSPGKALPLASRPPSNVHQDPEQAGKQGKRAPADSRQELVGADAAHPPEAEVPAPRDTIEPVNVACRSGKTAAKP